MLHQYYGGRTPSSACDPLVALWLRVDRRKRLSHFGAQGLAFLWGRRFRLPTDSFTASDARGSVLLRFCFFAGREDFSSGGLLELVQLIQAGSGRGEDAGQNSPSVRRHLIAMGLADLLNDSVSSQHS